MQRADEILSALVRRRDEANLQAPFDIDQMDLTRTRLTIRGRADRSVREGGIVPGPVQMAMADCFGWIMSVAELPPGSDALTVDMAVHFLRPLPVGGYRAECDLLSSSRRRSVVSMRLSAGPGEPVCTTVTMTFAPRSA